MLVERWPLAQEEAEVHGACDVPHGARPLGARVPTLLHGLVQGHNPLRASSPHFPGEPAKWVVRASIWGQPPRALSRAPSWLPPRPVAVRRVNVHTSSSVCRRPHLGPSAAPRTVVKKESVKAGRKHSLPRLLLSKSSGNAPVLIVLCDSVVPRTPSTPVMPTPDSQSGAPSTPRT